MILGVIETARKGASESSALGYIEAVEKQVAINELDSTNEPLNDGVYEISELKDTKYGITIKGDVPKDGWVVIKNGTIENYSFVIDEYVVTSGEDTAKGTTATKKTIGIVKSEVCKKVEKEEYLHTEECTQTDSSKYCSGAGYVEGKKGITITYGTIVSGELKSGDALDCDVDGNGTYDADERFYYVTDLEEDNNYAVLVYYNNIKNGVADNTSTSLIAYDLSQKNWDGPVTAISNLPTKTEEQWSNVSILNIARQITNEKGGNTTNNGSNTIESFSYVSSSGHQLAARLLTTQEVERACNITVGSSRVGELGNCNYLLENTKFSNSSIGTNGYWLENPVSSSSNSAWRIGGDYRSVYTNTVHVTSSSGVRPVIEVAKSDILY